MSADNGVFILETKAQGAENKIEYRVAHVGAIENFDYYKEKNHDEFFAYVKNTWGKSEVYSTIESALVKANEIFNKYPIVEYGISSIKEHDMVFPS